MKGMVVSMWWRRGGMTEAALRPPYQRMTEKPSGDNVEG
jgi:hypothetical protein